MSAYAVCGLDIQGRDRWRNGYTSRALAGCDSSRVHTQHKAIRHVRQENTKDSACATWQTTTHESDKRKTYGSLDPHSKPKRDSVPDHATARDYSMTLASQPESLAINTHHVQQQFERRLDRADPEFLYGVVAQRLFDRLKLIRLDAQQILDAGCGIGLRTALLRERFPKAHITSLDHSAAVLARLRQRLHLSAWSERWTRWRKKTLNEVRCADLTDSGLAPESLDLVWSNLAIHWHDRPHDVLKEWARIIRPNGLVLFSGWGPATGIELRQALTTAGLTSATLPLVDMHDLGDLMVQQGFADPVMDQETLTLTYDKPEALLKDAWVLGGNPNPNRGAGLVGRAWREKMCVALEKNRDAQSGKLHLTIEVAYGHAWRSMTRRVAGETRISLASIEKLK